MKRVLVTACVELRRPGQGHLGEWVGERRLQAVPEDGDQLAVCRRGDGGARDDLRVDAVTLQRGGATERRFDAARHLEAEAVVGTQGEGVDDPSLRARPNFRRSRVHGLRGAHHAFASGLPYRKGRKVRPAATATRERSSSFLSRSTWSTSAIARPVVGVAPGTATQASLPSSGW